VLRLGPAPLYTRFVDVFDAVQRMAEVLEAGVEDVRDRHESPDRNAREALGSKRDFAARSGCRASWLPRDPSQGSDEAGEGVEPHTEAVRIPRIASRTFTAM